MGCCGGDRDKDSSIRNDVKWEYVNLDDFKAQSCLTPFAFAYVMIMLIVSVSVYAVDTFTAVNLLAFNKWAGQIQPAIPLKYSKWIFAGCIILSFVLLFYRWLRALRVMRGGKVAKSYLDPLAVRVECIRFGSGRGWKRFLVFAELTKSRKGADYVALFALYSFEAWLRICLAEAPRIVINGITIYTVAQSKFAATGQHAATDGHSSFQQFWTNVGTLWDTEKMQAIVLFGMVWSCFIWLISAISLGVSVILYLIFLWHHIPSDAGGLTKYCRSKINRRMERIVKTKTDKALKKENERRAREEAKAYREGTDFKRQPTLPNIGEDFSPASPMPPLSRQTTMTTLPEYESRPGTSLGGASDSLPPMPPPPPDQYRPTQRRHMTQTSDASWSSYNSNAPLMNTAGDMGYSPSERSQTPSTPWSARPGFNRNMTGNSENLDRAFTPGPSRPGTAQGQRNMYQMEPLPRPGTSHSARPVRRSTDSDAVPPSMRSYTPVSHHPPSATAAYPPTLLEPRGRKTPTVSDGYFPPVSPIPEASGRESPAMFRGGPPDRSYTPAGAPPRAMSPNDYGPPPPPRLQTPGMSNNAGYMAFNPDRSVSESPRPPSVGTYRSFNRPQPHAMHDTYAPQQGLAPPRLYPPERGNSFDDILDHY